jgi:hypothetical protein
VACDRIIAKVTHMLAFSGAAGGVVTMSGGVAILSRRRGAGREGSGVYSRPPEADRERRRVTQAVTAIMPAWIASLVARFVRSLVALGI